MSEAVSEAVAQRGKLRLERLEVINLTIEDDHSHAVGRIHRLSPALDIDNRQAAMPKPKPRLDVKALPVRTAMPDRGGHPPQ